MQKCQQKHISVITDPSECHSNISLRIDFVSLAATYPYCMVTDTNITLPFLGFSVVCCVVLR